MSLVEALIATAVGCVVVFLTLQAIEMANSVQRRAVAYSNWQDTERSFRYLVRNVDTCTAMFGGKALSSKTGVVLTGSPTPNDFRVGTKHDEWTMATAEFVRSTGAGKQVLAIFAMTASAAIGRLVPALSVKSEVLLGLETSGATIQRCRDLKPTGDSQIVDLLPGKYQCYGGGCIARDYCEGGGCIVTSITGAAWGGGACRGPGCMLLDMNGGPVFAPCTAHPDIPGC
jgi:hypothetical protein